MAVVLLLLCGGTAEADMDACTDSRGGCILPMCLPGMTGTGWSCRPQKWRAPRISRRFFCHSYYPAMIRPTVEFYSVESRIATIRFSANPPRLLPGNLGPSGRTTPGLMRRLIVLRRFRGLFRRFGRRNALHPGIALFLWCLAQCIR